MSFGPLTNVEEKERAIIWREKSPKSKVMVYPHTVYAPKAILKIILKENVKTVLPTDVFLKNKKLTFTMRS